VKITGSFAPFSALAFPQSARSFSANALVSSGWSCHSSTKSSLKGRFPSPLGVAAHGAAIEADAGAGVLRRQADGDDALVLLTRNRLDRFGYEGLPVAHADEDRHLQGLRKLIGLQKCPAGKWRETDERIAMANLFEDGWRQRASAGDVAQKLGNLVGILGAAVGEQEHGSFRGLGGGKEAHLIRAVASAGEAQRAGRHFYTYLSA
jgi:hypothetical protein